MYGEGGTRGRTAKLGIDATTNQACAVLYEKKQEVETDYVWYFLQKQYDKLRSLSHGSARHNFNAIDIKNFEIQIPSIEDQKQIISQIEKLEAEINKAKETISKVQERKKTVLDKYLL